MATEIINGYSVNLTANKASGKVGVAVKGGKKFFCKRFASPVMGSLSKAISEATRAKYNREFEVFRRKKKRLNETLRAISAPGGNIVYPVEETVYDNHWIEFTEFCENTVPEDEYYNVIRTFDIKKKLIALKTAIAALNTLHEKHIVHADLKIQNIMLCKVGTSTEGNYSSKIIDFDGAFFEDDVPTDSITGTPDYYSPELGVYSRKEDPQEKVAWSKNITTKSDIFTMGLVFHEYLAGEKPKPSFVPTQLRGKVGSGKIIYPWQIVLLGAQGDSQCKLVISEKITSSAMRSLISEMLSLDPKKRPTAKEVLNRLKSIDVISLTNLNQGANGPNLRPEDALKYKVNEELLKQRGIKYIGPAEELGRKGYYFEIGGRRSFMLGKKCIMLKFFISK